MVADNPHCKPPRDKREMKCENCIYFVGAPLMEELKDSAGNWKATITRTEASRWGNCHFNPPQIGDNTDKKWPMVFKDDFCSQFKQK